VRNDGLQSYGGKLQWFRPTVLTQRPFLQFSELQLWEDGVGATRRHSTRHVNDVRRRSRRSLPYGSTTWASSRSPWI
jgi:hypothetical protein